MATDPRILAQQRAEITEHVIYRRLAERCRDPENRRVLERVAEEEYGHYEVWRSVTERELTPSRWRVTLYLILARLFGLAFALKLMEGDEEKAQAFYREMAPHYPQVRQIGEDEKRHEKALVDLLRDERLEYAGAIVLGLNDALVELTGTLAGLTLAFRNGPLIGVTGLVMGIAAAMSMAASGYLSAQEGETRDDPIKSAVYTGGAYILTVLVLVAPYFLTTDVFTALGAMLVLTLSIIAGYTFYISVAKGLAFRPRFLKMAAISVGVAIVSFVIGWGLKHAVGVDV